MPGHSLPMLQMHQLLAYTGEHAVTTLMVYGQKGLFTVLPSASDLDVSYLADTVLLLRYYEHAGEVRQALSAFKRRGGAHERTIRELRFGPRGLSIGEPLREFSGVLTGQPTFVGSAPRLEQP
ncbi:MAG: putative circadian clock protein KaiC, partial [Geminicoccaceae bacterium]|nr:putative circadian clock protein KaiC [Geminicoccaceae bacterium]